MRATIGMVAALFLSANVANAAVCATQAETAALSLRVLQSELVVAALSCDQKRRYNMFVQKFEEELVNRAAALKQYFARNFGGQATRELNAMVTSLANDASQRSLSQPSYCGDAVSLFDQVLQMQPQQLSGFAATLPTANRHGAISCR